MIQRWTTHSVIEKMRTVLAAAAATDPTSPAGVPIEGASHRAMPSNVVAVTAVPPKTAKTLERDGSTARPLADSPAFGMTGVAAFMARPRAGRGTQHPTARAEGATPPGSRG